MRLSTLPVYRIHTSFWGDPRSSQVPTTVDGQEQCEQCQQQEGPAFGGSQAILEISAVGEENEWEGRHAYRVAWGGGWLKAPDSMYSGQYVWPPPSLSSLLGSEGRTKCVLEKRAASQLSRPIALATGFDREGGMDGRSFESAAESRC